MNSDPTALLSAFGIGGLLGSVVTLLVNDRLSRLAERRSRRVETDRETYHNRGTRLIAANLAAYIRSNRCRADEREDLAELIQNLSDGECRRRFLDPCVQAAWETLVAESAECGWRRHAGVITEQEIADYTKVWERWMLLARESFGPVGESDPPSIRRRPCGVRELDKAA